jgi:hypothetical protein
MSVVHGRYPWSVERSPDERFGLYVPLSAAVLVIAPRFLAFDRPEERGSVAWGPALLVTTGLVTLVYAVGRGGTAKPGEVIALLGTGLSLVTVFLLIQSRAAQPLLPLPLLADHRIAAASLALAGAFAGVSGAMFLVSLALQKHHGYSPLSAGLAFLPQGLAVGHAAARAPGTAP